MNLYDLVNPDDLEEAIEDRLINVRHSTDGYRIYNYSDKAMYTPGAWDNPAVRQCRRLIVSPGDKIIARPWSKFFNHSQKEAGNLDLNAPVEVTDKADGSLGILFINANGEPQIATRGSFESEMAVHATEMFRQKYMNVRWQEAGELTFLFEIIYPENRVVLDYQGLDDLVLLGAVIKKVGKYVGPESAAFMLDWTGPITKVFHYRTLKEALEAPPRKNAEGLCVRFLEENRIVKIKQESYLEIHGLLTRSTPKLIWERMLKGENLDSLLAGVPDEFYYVVLETYDALMGQVTELERECLLEYSRISDKLKSGPRKDFAEAVKNSRHRAGLFKLLDNKPIREIYLKEVKPINVVQRDV